MSPAPSIARVIRVAHHQRSHHHRYDSEFNRNQGQFHGGSDPQFAAKLTAMLFDRLDAAPEIVGDFLRDAPACDQIKELKLAWGQVGHDCPISSSCVVMSRVILTRLRTACR